MGGGEIERKREGERERARGSDRKRRREREREGEREMGGGGGGVKTLGLTLLAGTVLFPRASSLHSITKGYVPTPLSIVVAQRH